MARKDIDNRYMWEDDIVMNDILYDYGLGYHEGDSYEEEEDYSRESDTVYNDEDDEWDD